MYAADAKDNLIVTRRKMPDFKRLNFPKNIAVLDLGSSGQIRVELSEMLFDVINSVLFWDKCSVYFFFIRPCGALTSINRDSAQLFV